MTTINSATRVTAITSTEVLATARRASRLFLGSFAGFVGIVITSSVIDADRDTAQREAADELGVNLNHLPADVLAQILREDSSTVATVLTIAFAIISVALFAAAIRSLSDVAGERNLLARGAFALALLGGVAFLAMILSELLLRSEPPWLVHNWWLYMTLVAVFVVAACFALTLAVIRLWDTGHARRSAVVVIVICLLTVVAQVTVNAPPIVPMLLGAIYAFNLTRSVRAAA
jgi:hypothetical protein